MKRCCAGLLVLVLLLVGCGKEIGESVPNEFKDEKSCISVEILAEPTDFGGFTACAPDALAAARAGELVETVLARYPAGFAEQWGSVEILLVGEVTGEDQFAHGAYAGFSQRTADGWRMVLDASRCDTGTVHHEIAHILDGILTDAGVLTEADWMGFCPGGFSYGQVNWADYPDFFVDAYAMTNIREDRARTFEQAALVGEGVYGEAPALWLKLDCFGKAIRSYFDTTGWPEKTFWELALES